MYEKYVAGPNGSWSGVVQYDRAGGRYTHSNWAPSHPWIAFSPRDLDKAVRDGFWVLVPVPPELMLQEGL